ncbi:MAG: NAD(P)-binding domain-containing protein [Pseudomonadota bacterium]
MADVSFVGLGNMGLALARTAALADLDVVVWNRTAAKADPLRPLGVLCAATAAEAVAASPVTVVCVYDYEAANAILMHEDCIAALTGRVLVQLTTATPRAARAMHDWAQQSHIAYLDGELIAYPSDIGGDDARIIVAGDETALRTASPVLDRLAPEIEYLGADPSRAAALNLAICSASLGRIIGTLNAAAICEAAHIPLERFAKTMDQDAQQESRALAESLKKIESGNLDTAEASIEVWAALPQAMTEFAQDTGYSPDVSEFMRQLFDRAVRQGLGEHDVGALIKVLRP